MRDIGVTGPHHAPRVGRRQRVFRPRARAVPAPRTSRARNRAEFHYVAKHELVFRDKKTNKRKRGAYNEPSLRVFATANGVTSETRDDVSFIGVSNGTLTDGQHAHSAVTIAGLTTICNTGNRTIEAGDTVVWDVNDAKDPDNKARKTFSTIPYHEAFDHGADSHFAAVGAAIDDAAKGNAAKGNAAKCARMIDQISDSSLKSALIKAFNEKDSDLHRKFLKCYVHCTRAVDSRVIGTAMTKSKEGQEFRHSSSSLATERRCACVYVF